MFISYIKKIDKKVINYVSFWQRPFLSKFLMPFTKLGSLGVIWLVLAIPMLINESSRKVGIKVVLMVLVTGLIGEVFIKHVAKRKRPSKYIEEEDMLIRKPITYSFPSGHTSSSVASAVVISFSYRFLAVPVCILAFLVSFSRLYFKVHYPSDIIAGAILGVLCATVVNFIF